MILLSDVINELVSGEAGQIASVVTKSSGQFNRNKTNDILVIVNAALKEIYKRFIVANDMVQITTQEGVRDYLIDIKNKVGINPDGFIASNFNKEVIAILGVHDMAGNALKFNRMTDVELNELTPTVDTPLYGVFSLSQYNKLRTPPLLAGTQLQLRIRAGHVLFPMVPAENLLTFDLNSVEMDLPYTYQTAIVYYMLSRLMNSKGAENLGRSPFHEGNNYYEKFLRECESLRQSDSEVVKQIDYSQNYQRTGFF